MLFRRRPKLRTLTDIQSHGTDIVQSADSSHDTFWVLATVRGERIEFQMSGLPGDPAAEIVDWAPTRFLA